MNIFLAFCFCVATQVALSAQICDISYTTNGTSSITIGNNFSQEWVISNNSDNTIEIDIADVFESYGIDVEVILDKNNINANGTANLVLTGIADNYIPYEGLITVSTICKDNALELHIPFDITPVYADQQIQSYWSNTYGLWGAELKDTISSIITRTHDPLSYRDARDYMYTFVDNFNNTLECVYTGRQIQHTSGRPNVNTTGINTEHSWPQSFGASVEPALSDAFHFYPCDQNANSERGNTEFGLVTGTVFFQQGGSKLGLDDIGRRRFEPRDIKKGDIARGLFYFSLRYGNIDNYLASQEEILREWSDIDQPDTWETNRGNGIFEMQKNRNPFIDNPAYLEQIPSISFNDDVERKRDIQFNDDDITFSFDALGITDLESTVAIRLFNSGLEEGQILFVSSDNNDFIPSISEDDIISPDGDGVVMVTVPNADDSATITIVTNGGTFTKKIITIPTFVSVEESEDVSYIINGQTILAKRDMFITISDINGRIVRSQTLKAGESFEIGFTGKMIISTEINGKINSDLRSIGIE
jgi:hypothetical protein